MRVDDFLYGSRSGIQKAVRRGDLALGRTCFDALWGNKTHRAWLRWRTPVLVIEETSYLCGELAEFFIGKYDDERSWRKFLYELILAPKAKDGTGLLRMLKGKSKISNKEIDFLRPWFKNPDVDPAVVVKDVVDALFKRRKLNEYEAKAIRFLQNRVSMGGWLGDRQLCLTNMVLISFRGLDKEEVRGVIDDSVNQYAELHGKPKPLDELPWFIFDMHTAIGKIALSILCKRKIKKWKITEEDLRNLWFLLESGVVRKDQMKYSKMTDNPTPFESIWLMPSIRNKLNGIRGMTVEEIANFWKEKIKPEVESVVKWLLDKRSEEN